jgi:predicted Zn-dependent peptidase
MEIKIPKSSHVYFQILIRTGKNNDPQNHLEVSHMVEHMVSAYTSTKYRSGKKNKQVMEMEGIKYNAYTTDFVTGYYVICNSESFESIILDMMLHAFVKFHLDEDILSQEKESVISELNMRYGNDIWNHLFEAWIKTLYPHIPHRCSTYQERIKSIKAMKTSHIIEYFKKYYIPTNISFIAAGDFDSKFLIRKIESIFSTATTTAAAVPFPLLEAAEGTPFKGEQKFHLVNKQCKSARVEFTWLLRKKLTPSDLKKYYSVVLLLYHLVMGFDSVLMRLLRTQHGYVYFISNYYDITYNGLGYIYLVYFDPN